MMPLVMVLYQFVLFLSVVCRDARERQTTSRPVVNGIDNMTNTFYLIFDSKGPVVLFGVIESLYS